MDVPGIEYVLLLWVLLINIIFAHFIICIFLEKPLRFLEPREFLAVKQGHWPLPHWVIVGGRGSPLCDCGWHHDHSTGGILIASFPGS